MSLPVRELDLDGGFGARRGMCWASLDSKYDLSNTKELPRPELKST